jgi:hypothetical protein
MQILILAKSITLPWGGVVPGFPPVNSPPFSSSIIPY